MIVFSDNLLRRLYGEGFKHGWSREDVEPKGPIKAAIDMAVSQNNLDRNSVLEKVESEIARLWRNQLLLYMEEFVTMAPIVARSLQNRFPEEYVNASSGPVGIDNLIWTHAVASYDFGAPDFLAEMIEQYPIPKKIRPVISGIIQGARKPKSKRKLKGGARAGIAYALWVYSRVREESLGECEEIADILGVDPTEAYKIINKLPNALVDIVSQIYEMSEESVKDLRLDFAEILKIWD